MPQIKERIEIINQKISDLTKAKFTGSITTVYHLLDGRLMGLEFETREQINKNAEILNVGELST